MGFKRSKLYRRVLVMLFNLFTGLMGLPKRNGKLKDLSKFDADFFGVHHKQAMYMDPQLRIMLELSFEAMIDAGI